MFLSRNTILLLLHVNKTDSDRGVTQVKTCTKSPEMTKGRLLFTKHHTDGL